MKNKITYDKIKSHIGHDVEVVSYGDDMQNVAIECIECNEVIIDEDK
jgi:hypothetical protein